MSPRVSRTAKAAAFGLAAALLLGASSRPLIPWEDLTEADWLYGLATRFSLVDSHRVHYKTPTAELASLLETRPETEALRHLAQAQMDLGQRERALETIEKWATAWSDSRPEEPGAGWDEAARWAWTYGAHEQAFRFADRAVPMLKGETQRALAELRIRWAEEQPALRHRRDMQRQALELNATDWATAFTWVESDISSERLEEAEAGLATLPASTPDEAVLVLRARLRVAQRRGTEVLDEIHAALDRNPRRGRLLSAVYAQVIDQAAKDRPDEWRSILSTRFDPAALIRLFTYFKGQARGDACLSLLQQIDRRYQDTLDRPGWSLLSSLYSEIDAAPEAFRARLAAATFSQADAEDSDLAELARLALRASGRPLAWGHYSDADYRWVARMDSTPGFWTGGLSLLLTGQDWSEALSRLEAESIPERTFGAARALLSELIRRHPGFEEIPKLKLEVMQRHVDRGEGREALALLRDLEGSAPDDVRLKAQNLGLLALRQTEGTLAEESRLYRARLRALAPDGSKPPAQGYHSDPLRRFDTGDFPQIDGGAAETAESRLWLYKPVLDDALVRLDDRDRSHRAALSLILAELDRLPEAEALWLDLAGRLDSWNLDDELGPRYEAALQRFDDPSWWNRMARYLTRQKRQAEIRGLAEQIAATFRASDLFSRAADANVRIEIPEQPRVGTRVRLVPWGDWVVLKALERFPHSPVVLHAAEGRLIRASVWEARAERTSNPRQSAVVEDSLLAERRWAIFAADAGVREAYFAGLMATGSLEARLEALEGAAERTPVDDLILAEGYARVSLFEKAAGPASLLSAAYPGEVSLARNALQIHRSLAGLDLSHEGPARTLVERTAPALPDPHPFLTELGELYEETGRPAMALTVWKGLLDRDPRQEYRIKETAALLWDYGHMREALDVIEAARERVGRPRMLAFEAGVLREEVRDLDGAIREYLDAVRPETDADACYCSGFENDQRSLRRLAQWMGRERVLQRVLRTIDALEPGNQADEKTLLALWPLGSIVTPTPGLSGDADDWIDGLDLPNDPVGREEREASRLAARGSEHDGILRAARALVARGAAMTPHATNGRFLTALESSASAYNASAWARAEGRERFFTDILARQAALAPTLEERLRLEISLAERLANADRISEANAVWAALAARLDTMPEGASRIQAEAARAAFIERTSGFEAANAAWSGLMSRYPWSLGVIEDRVAFLQRNGRGGESRQALEEATARAAEGHLVPLLTRLISESLAARDLPRASRAIEHLLGTPGLTEAQRLGAVSLQARLRLQQDAGFDALRFADGEALKFKADARASVFVEVARAAVLEKAYATSVPVWIEALNRSTQRDWLKEASRAARRAGRSGELISFFERQRERSPRDVRWAVASRELRVANDDLSGGIEMARMAASVRPERQDLWDEAVELMERDRRFEEAADFLEGWNLQRPADPNVAGRRSELYIRAGNLDRALSIEQSALAAFEATEPEPSELEFRRAEAARRLWRSGEPALAWRFLVPDRAPAEIASASGLSIEEQFQLAILNQSFLPVFLAGADDDERTSAAATILSQYGRLDDREQVLDWLVEQILPSERPNDDLLNAWWSFIQNARLEPAFRFRMAQKLTGRRTGPWSVDAPADFLDDVSEQVVDAVTAANERATRYRLRLPDLDALWTAHLVRFDRADELAAFLQPRFTALLQNVRGTLVVDENTRREAWTAWLDGAPAMAVFARGLRSRPEMAAELSDVFADPGLWPRLAALAARGWDASPLLSELRPEARVAWLSYRERPLVPAPPVPGTSTPPVENPVLAARRAILNDTSVSLTRFLSAAGRDGVGDPGLFAERLLGPGTLGEILGDDPRFIWPMFRPRTSVMGMTIETGEDRVVGRGVDALRFPGALWGERPGLAWYALQTLARYRAGDASAIDVPAEWPEAGMETEKVVLAVRLALALRSPSEALGVIERLGLRTNDSELLHLRLKLLVEAGRRADANEALKRRLIADQGRLGEESLRTYVVMAEDLGLASPLSLLDPATPISPALLASLYDRQGVDTGRRFKTDDPVGFRAALTARWFDKAGDLKEPELRLWLRELWANESASLPLSGLHLLGDYWPLAAAWADSIPVTDRERVIQAIDALPDTARLDAFPDRVGSAPARRLLIMRARLARGDDEAAVSLFKAGLAATEDPAVLALQAIDLPDFSAGSGQDGPGRERGDVSYQARPGYEEWTPPPSPAVVAVRALRAPFSAAGKTALIHPDLIAWLDERIEAEPGDLDMWSLRFEVAGEAERLDVGERLRLAYRRGDIPAYRQAEIVTMLVEQAKDLAAPWILEARPYWPSFSTVQKHAGWLRDTGRNRDAAKYLVEARSKTLFERSEEIEAFDSWRRSVGETGDGPGVWKDALRFWRDDPETISGPLQARLKEHSMDALSARAALRLPTAMPPQLSFLAIRALRDIQDVSFIDTYADESLLRLRAARSLMAEPRAARAIGGGLAPEWAAEELDRRRFEPSEVNAAIADLARLAAADRDQPTMRRALALLADRKWDEAPALRAELARAPVDPPLVSHRVAAGGPFLYRPRDLTFALVSRIVQSDLSRRMPEPPPAQSQVQP